MFFGQKSGKGTVLKCSVCMLHAASWAELDLSSDLMARLHLRLCQALVFRRGSKNKLVSDSSCLLSH